MSTTRRTFLQSSSAAASLGAAAAQTVSKNDQIQVALIGAGGMGQGDARNAVSLPGVKLVAAADIYDSRLERVQEQFGKDVATTRDYREILNRKDIDAVIIATPDHWHAQISIDALNAGKDVYCEKPMVQKIEEGHRVIEAHKRSGRIFVVGSQYVSSLVFVKAQQLFQQGAIGELNMVEAWLDRNTALGAWQYSIPPDASPANIDWDRFLGSAPKRPFEPIRLFRWRNYDDYGTGLAGDLFVHLLSGLHLVTSSLGPTRIYASGGLRFWKDGRDAPDVMLALLEYPKTAQHPEFTLALRVNFASSEPEEQFGFRFVGSEGMMHTSMSHLKLTKTPRETEPGYTSGAFSKRVQDEIVKQYREKYPPRAITADSMRPDGVENYSPRGFNAHLEHHRNFYTAVRTRKPFIEDSTFGLRTAGPALLCNESYRQRKALGWDVTTLKQV